MVKKKNPTQDDKERLAIARNRLDLSIAYYSSSRNDELNDLRFFAGSPDNKWQWPDDVWNNRTTGQGPGINARPCLTINKLPQHVRQVTNEQRQNRPAGKVIPVDDNADIEVARIYDGMVRHIEYISDADVVYDTASENQVTYGEGYWRLITQYCDDDTFDQDIRLKRIRNSFSVYMDPMIQDPCGADAEWCFISEELTHDEYKRDFPNALPISELSQFGVGDNPKAYWINEKTVRIAEYFYAEYEAKRLNMYDPKNVFFEGTPEDDRMKQAGIAPIKTRIVNIRSIKWCKINGYEILEEREWAGKYIPVVRVVGNEFEVQGEVYMSGIVRNAKDAQRMYNYWSSQEAEMLALAPKAPFIGYGGQFEGYEDQWKTANVKNWPYLEVNPDVTDGQGAVLPLPQRAMPPMAQTGLIQAKLGAADDIKSTTGQYDSSLGATSNERSGKAILARERQGDVGTYHYVDNLARAIRFSTRQIVDLIPKIYDTERIARIIGIDGETDQVKLNPDQQIPIREIQNPMNGAIEKIYNLNVGKYDVCVTTGPSYITKRQEAVDAMVQLVQANPQLWSIIGDLLVKNMDWPGAQEMADRIARTMDPKLLQNPNESAEMQAANIQIQQMSQELDHMHEILKNVSKSLEVQDAVRKDMETEIKAYAAETDRLKLIQASMSPDQIQDIVMGTIHSMMVTGDLTSKLAEQMIEPIQQEETREPLQEATMEQAS